MISRSKQPTRRRKRRIWPAILLILTGLGLAAAYFVFGPNTGSFSRGEYLYIPTGSTYSSVQQALKEGGFVRNMQSFDLLARQAGYPALVKAGRYRITKGMSNYELVRKLRSGSQEPVRLVINKLRTKEDFIRLISTKLEAKEASIRHLLSDPVYLTQFGLDTTTAMCAVMPDTYEFWWNTTADKAFRKIEQNYARFWTDERKAKAKAKGLSPQETIILASIVEEETNLNSEKPTIASVYLNRLKKGERLGADPTVKFALGNFSITRIYNKHTAVASPYNTYRVTGLPPGPICTPGRKSIEAVLNAPQTSYMFFCAKGDGSGGHLFATTYSEHLKNARAYHQLQNERGNR
jgi:UPF0755 protein